MNRCRQRMWLLDPHTPPPFTPSPPLLKVKLKMLGRRFSGLPGQGYIYFCTDVKRPAGRCVAAPFSPSQKPVFLLTNGVGGGEAGEMSGHVLCSAGSFLSRSITEKRTMTTIRLGIQPATLLLHIKSRGAHRSQWRWEHKGLSSSSTPPFLSCLHWQSNSAPCC